MTKKRRRAAKDISDANQLRIWQAAIVLTDARMRWPRALQKAIWMIAMRDRKIAELTRNPTQ